MIFIQPFIFVVNLMQLMMFDDGCARSVEYVVFYTLILCTESDFSHFGNCSYHDNAYVARCEWIE
jgi:hypothetical protein